MRQRQVIKDISDKLDKKQAEIKTIVDALIKEMQSYLLNDKPINIKGFGTLSKVKYKEKKAVIPGKEGVVNIPAAHKVQFKIDKTLKEEIQALKK